MRYTLLKVADEGVVLARFHAERMAPEGDAVLRSFERFANEAAPGVWAVTAQDGVLSTEKRGPSRLTDGMPTRVAISPVASASTGAFPKPPSPSPYDGVRMPGISTLLTSSDGEEILESCSAAVLAWDGGWWAVPRQRPRVESVAENAVRTLLSVGERPLAVDSALPLVLINAVKGVCTVQVPGRPQAPSHAVDELRRCLGG